jgi:crossover junction endodeoxyribonuclease RuvC
MSEFKAKNVLPVEKIILGIDPGTQVFGYGVLRQNGRDLTAIQMGVVRLEKFKSHEIRLARIYEKVTQLIEQYLPDEMAIESPFYGKNIQIALKLGRAQGVSMAAAIARQIPIAEYAPKKIKLSVTGNGNASKEQVAAMVVRLLNLKPENFLLDATDALAIAITHVNQAGRPQEAGGSWSQFVKENTGRIRNFGAE